MGTVSRPQDRVFSSAGQTAEAGTQLKLGTGRVETDCEGDQTADVHGL